MKYAYAVKFNGKYYMAGEEVPVDNKVEKVASEKEATEQPIKAVKKKATKE